ncbi:MAG: hypothetical protein HYV60_13080 [Planctomycetia bacterium]|nr:hypothetical protein [Planctomycetia bacterium]
MNRLNINAAYANGVVLRGGNPSGGSDSATINGVAGNDVIGVTLGATGDTVSGIVAGNVTLVGVENLTVNGDPAAGDAGVDAITLSGLGGVSDLHNVALNGGTAGAGADATDTVGITGTANPDDFNVWPISDTSAVIESVNGVGPTVTANLNNAATSTFTVNGGASNDKVTVHGTVADDAITVTRAAGASTVLVNNGANLKIVTLAENTPDALTVDGGDGDDTITVNGTGGGDLTVRGGDPTNSQAAVGDTLIVNLGGGIAVVSPGATPDAGLVQGPAAGDDVDFFGLEVVSLVAPAAAGDEIQVQGTNDSDSIAALNDPMNPGNRVWVNDRAVVTFLNYETLTLQGRFGDDQISVTPGTLVGVTTINAQGGDPTASDTLIVTGTAGNDAMVYTPGATNDAATVDVDGASAIAPVVGTTIESVVIHGGGNILGDTLLVNATANLNDIITLTPGSAQDAGGFRVNSFAPVAFTNLGVGGSLTVDGLAGAGDTLVYNGTAASDIFTIPAVQLIGNQVDLVVNGDLLNPQIAVGSVGVEDYTFRGLGGDDIFNIRPLATVDIQVQGDEPGASDILNFFTVTGPTIVN